MTCRLFTRCSLQDIIDPAGWESWKAGVSVPDTIYYGEFQNRGDGARTQDRVKWPGFHDITDPMGPFSYKGKKFWMSRRVFDQMSGGFFGH